VRRGETADHRGNEAPEATGGGTWVLDAISGFLGPVGPFGQDLRYGSGCGRVNAVIHELRTPRVSLVHELSAGVEKRVENRGDA
jgi:hypothetical protein